MTAPRPGRRLAVLAIGIVVLVPAIRGIRRGWRNRELTRELPAAQRALRDGDAEGVWRRGPSFRELDRLEDATREAWSTLLIGSAVQSRSVARLLHLHQQDAARVEADDGAASLLARLFIARRDLAGCRRLIDRWKPVSSRTRLWSSLEAEWLQASGRIEDARRELEAHRFSGSEEAGRLLQLALLELPRSASRATRILEEAAREDPRRVDVQLLRAGILLGQGNSGAAAGLVRTALSGTAPEPWLVRSAFDALLAIDQPLDAATLVARVGAAATGDLPARAALWDRLLGSTEVPPELRKQVPAVGPEDFWLTVVDALSRNRPVEARHALARWQPGYPGGRLRETLEGLVEGGLGGRSRIGVRASIAFLEAGWIGAGLRLAARHRDASWTPREDWAVVAALILAGHPEQGLAWLEGRSDDPWRRLAGAEALDACGRGAEAASLYFRLLLEPAPIGERAMWSILRPRGGSR